MSHDAKLRDHVALRILTYLLAHPHAADSDAGVGLWWLRGEAPVPLPVVRDVLESLVRRDWLECHGGGAETRVYRFNPSEEDAVRRFTEQFAEERHG